MKRINISYFLFLLLLMSCEKQTPEPIPTLSEYIIGDWEVRESIDIINFGDYEYHSIGPPYIAFYRFKEDKTFELWINGNPRDARSFSVNEQDSVLTLISNPWELYSFNEMVLDIRAMGGHGLQGHRLYKID